MEEAKHAWASLRSVRKLSSSTDNWNENENKNGNSTAIWYDIPAPVIIHCREFGEAKAKTETETEADTEVEEGIEEAAINSETPRHRNTVELAAVTSVKIDEAGVPKISFSFLHGENAEVAEDERDAWTLYDLPRNSYVLDGMEIETEANREDGKLATGSVEVRGEIDRNKEIASEKASDIDIGIDTGIDIDIDIDIGIDIEDEKKSEEGGIGLISGPYSDPDCSEKNNASPNGSRRNGQYPKKHRLGKAWERMRSWLRDETSRINQVVNRHARFQAVGVLVGDSPRCPSSIPLTRKVNGARYDLTKAKPRETGSITRAEEFGLASVSEENLVCSTNCAITNAPPLSLSTSKLSPIISDTDNEQTRKPGPIKKKMLGSIKGLMASTHLLQTHDIDEGGQGGFEDVRRYVKQGGDFCKELASILHERAELEATYAKGLSKLSNKLTKACAKDQGGNGAGGVNEAWRCVGEEMEAAAEAHRIWGMTLGEQLAKPLRVGVAEAQGRSRKSIENSVDKAGKSLHEWRNIATKSKKQSFACARENERLQDLARLQSISQSQQSNNKSSNHHVTEKEATKLEARRRKAEDSSRRADTEFYTVSVRAERARLEYESTMRKGAKQMELLEEERLSALKDLANVYLAHLQALAPRLQQSADRLAAPIRNCNVSQDVEILKNLIRRVESNDGCNADQLLPDFYAEHVTLAMNRERRKQALVRVLHLIRQDLERERRGREGLETLHRAFVATPAFAADESTQNVTDKLHHMRSMLLYLEAARYKVGGTLAEVEGSKRGKHPLAEHILVSRDKQGLQQSVLKIPSWAKNESFEIQDATEDDVIDDRLAKDQDAESRHWADRTAGDGNSENPPDEDDFSDFDEFSSHSEDNNNHQDVDAADTSSKIDGTEQCRAIYQYAANLNDELSLSPGDLITVHQKQADGWWIGECKGRTGIFPATYVQVIH